MAKNKISEYSATAANNTDVANINIAEGCSPSNVNNAIRGVMAHLKDFQAGNQTGNALAVAGGGTGAESASAARTNLGAAGSGANSDITSLTGITTPLSVAQGGSGAATLTGYLKGNGTSAFTAQTTPIPVADGGTGLTSAGTSGNVLTSDGTNWTSSALPNIGKILQVVSTTKTSQFSTSSATLTDVTGMSASITPSSASSKIYIIISISIGDPTGAYPHWYVQRDTTNLALGDTPLGSSSPSSFATQTYPYGGSHCSTHPFTYLDSPSSTSSLTYKIQVKTYGGRTIYVNQSGDTSDADASKTMSSTITLMEVGA